MNFTIRLTECRQTGYKGSSLHFSFCCGFTTNVKQSQINIFRCASISSTLAPTLVNPLVGQRHFHISNVSASLNRRRTFEKLLHLFNFSPPCFFKCALKWPKRKGRRRRVTRSICLTILPIQLIQSYFILHDGLLTPTGALIVMMRQFSISPLMQSMSQESL